MARDYAKKRGSGKRNTRSSGGAAKVSEQRDTGWSWFFSGLFSGLFIAFIAYLALNRPALPPTVVDTDEAVAAEQSEEGREGFDFYQYLPTAEVQVDVVPVDITRNQEPVDDNQQYMLQAGSFQDQQDAEGRRASIILLNLNARVTPGTVAGSRWHRVQVGPFAGRQAAEEARQTLSSNNIDTIVLQLR